MISRQNRMNEMIRAGRTIEELVTVPSSTKLISNGKGVVKHGEILPELWKAYNKERHPSVHWKLARRRYWDGWTIADACNKPKGWRPSKYNK